MKIEIFIKQKLTTLERVLQIESEQKDDKIEKGLQ